MKTPRSLSQAYDFIRNKIIAGDFPPNYRLMTRNLSAESGVSRTPVRDALRLLEKEGLVDIQPRIGASVKAFDFLSFQEVCEFRLGMESFSASLAAKKRTPVELAEIESVGLAMGEMVRQRRVSDDPQLRLELRKHDIRFHFAIATAAHNRELLREIMRLQVVLHMVSGPMPASTPLDPQAIAERDAAQAAHWRIYEAIRDRDATAARMAMQHHMQIVNDRALMAAARKERQHAVDKATLFGATGLA